MKQICVPLIVAAASVVSTASPAFAATSGSNGTHDPSRIIESDGKFYFCGTGGRCASSTNGLAWSQTGLSIPTPSWAKDYMNSNGQTQGIWAPDIIFYDDKYYIYYSFCGTPAAHAPCVVGLYTTPTLDSTSSKFKLTDVGKVVNNPPNTTGYQFSTIDPAPVIDGAGNLWSSWGSGYGKDTSKLQIYVTRMDSTGLPLATDPGYKPPMTLGYGLETGGIEGSYVHFHGGNYYLFWNSGGCCSGASSTYTVHVARSPTISGPYTGAKVWFSSSGSMHGPGHIGIYSACNVERFTYHYYPDSGGSVLGENELSWDADGWPVPGAPSTTPLTPCGPTSAPPVTGGGEGGSAGSAPPIGGAGGAGGSPTLPVEMGGSGPAAGGGETSDDNGGAPPSTIPDPEASSGSTSGVSGAPSAAGSPPASAAGDGPAGGADADGSCAYAPAAPNDHKSAYALLALAVITLGRARRKKR